jgi:DNA (cytosine-5)-methyltransferase 1
MAGFRELLAVEWDDNAVATFRLNFPDVPVYHGDIARLSVEQVLEMTGLQPGELDVFDGSPPCQGFSTAGKRQIDDPRNQLFREYVRLLRGLQPKVFVMENVSGMVKGKMKLVFVDILRELKASGYRVSARLLNAMYFNVPQSRERMIFIGVRDDLGIEPSHPKAQSQPVTVREALEQLPSNFDVCSPAVRGRVPQMMAKCRPGMSLAASTGQGAFYSWVRAAWDKPCMTVQKSVTFGGFSIWHPSEDRSLSGREVARIGSWPDGYEFVGEYKDWVARIGNSVPPLFMRAIARHIRAEILRA